MIHSTGPFAELTRLQNELNRIFASLLESSATPEAPFGGWDPPMDVVDTPGSIRIFLELPGVPLETLSVTSRGDAVTVSGTKVPPAGSPDAERRFHCLERTFGSFSKTITINHPVNTHQGTASLAAGVLRLEFPKVPDLRSREVSIPVTAGEPPAPPRPSGAPKNR